MSEAEILAERIRSGDIPWEELAELARHEHRNVRGVAVISIGERFAEDPRTLALLEEIAKDPRNQTPIMGMSSIAQVALDLLSKLK